MALRDLPRKLTYEDYAVFERFEAFARRVLSVPKAEIDERTSQAGMASAERIIHLICPRDSWLKPP
jgi:hypothetical protein